jgi:hypothetical protein
MPGPANIIITMNFDRKKMTPEDWQGKLGMKFHCKLKRVEKFTEI